MPCFRDFCFPFPEFQVERVGFDGTNYYIFIFDTLYSPKPCQRFLKGSFVCILQPEPRNSDFRNRKRRSFIVIT